MRQQITILIGTSIDPDSWNFNKEQNESFVASYLEIAINLLITDAIKNWDTEASVDFVDFEYGEII